MKTGNTDQIGKNIIWISDLYSMNHRQDIDKIPDSSAVLLQNISLARPGNWIKRMGSKLLTAATTVGVGVFGLISYVKLDGTYTLRTVKATNIYTYDPSGDTFTSTAAGAFTASTKVESTNYLNRVYHVTTSDFLCYESGGAITTVGTGNDRLRAIDVETAQNTLFVGGVTYGNASAQSWQDRVYYSLYDSAHNVASHQLWNTTEGSLINSTRYFSVINPVKALVNYNNVIHVFTYKNCWNFNMRYEQQDVGPQEVFKQGIANARAWCICNGYLCFMSPDKRLWAWGGSQPLMELSWDIEDEELGRAIINALSTANIADVAMGALNNQIWVSIGDVTYLGKTVKNAVLRGLFTQNLGSVYWSVDSYPVKPSIFANTYINNQEVLCFGTSAGDLVEDVYQMNSGTNDGSIAVDAFARTKFYDLGMPITTKNNDKIYIKYAPQPGTDTFLKVSYAIDGKFTYYPITDPDGTPPVTKHSSIDMYESDSATNIDAIKVISFPAGTNFRTISFEIANAQSGESFEVKAIGMSFDTFNLDILPNKAA